MAIEGLTQTQSAFLERFVQVSDQARPAQPKDLRAESIPQTRLFEAAQANVRDIVLAVGDSGVRSALLARVDGADAVLEQIPETLDFDAAHKHLQTVQTIAQQHALQEQAETKFAAVAKQMEGAQAPDVAHVWAYAQDRYAAGVATRSAPALEQALEALERLDPMLKGAARRAENPFVTAKQLPEADPNHAAQRALRALFDQLAMLDADLAVTFGEGGVPLSLRIAVSGVRNKLNTAADAPPAHLPSLAEDVENDFALAQRDAGAAIAAAQKWHAENAQFRVRYAVLQAHSMVGEERSVAPAFASLTVAYKAAQEKAAVHDYDAATQDIGVLRHDLKDALDLADDCAAFDALLAQSKAQLGRLPGDASFAIDRLRQDAEDARALLSDAVNLRADGQSAAAQTMLNRIPGAVADILAAKQFANDFNAAAQKAQHRQSAIAGSAGADILGMMASAVEDVKAQADAAEADAARGEYRSAASQMRDVLSAISTLESTATYLKTYVHERAGLDARLQETKIAEGREAIESYYQALRMDVAKRDAAESAGDYSTAMACCLRLKDSHDDMIRQAEDAEGYLDRKLDFEVAMATLSDDPAGQDARITGLAQLADAVATSMRGNWLGATNQLDAAILALEQAEADSETMEEIDALYTAQDAPDLAAGGDFDAAFGRFEKVLNRVNALDTEALFMDGLIDAELMARAAEDDMADDPKAAQATLDAAVADCKGIARALGAAAGFADRIAITQRLVDEAAVADLPEVDVTLAQSRFATAQAMAQEDTPDFPAAFALLSETETDLRTSMEAQTLSGAKITQAHATFARVIALCEGADVTPFLNDQASVAQDLRAGMDADFDAGKLEAAATKAAQADDLLSAANEAARDVRTGAVLLKSLLELPAHPATTADNAEIDQLCVAARAALQNGQFAAALEGLKQAQSLAARTQAKTAAFDHYLPRKLATQDRLAKLSPRAVFETGPAHTRVEALHMRSEQASDAEGRGDFSAAARLLEGVETECAAVAVLLDQYDAALLAKTHASDGLQDVNANRTPEIEPIYDRLSAKMENAARLMDTHDFDAARGSYTEVAADCAQAEETLADLTGIADLADGLGTIEMDDTQGLLVMVAGVRQRLDKLRADPSAIYAPDEIDAVDALLNDAQTTAPRDFAAARDDLETATERCSQIAVLMSQFNYMERMYAKVRGIAADLIGRHDLRREEDHKDYALQDIIARMAMLDTAVGAARSSADQRTQTQLDIEETITTLHDLRPVLDKHLAYVRERTPVDRTLYELERGAQRQLIRDHLRLARRHLDIAGTRAQERSHRAAREEITAAKLQLDMAGLRIKVATNDTPGPEDIKPLLDSPEGMDSLDVTVNALDPDAQREVMAAAFEARFGCKLETDAPDETKDRIDLPGVNIARFYKEMAKLPPSAEMEDDQILTFLDLSGIGQGAAPVARGASDAAVDLGADLGAAVGDVNADATPLDGAPMSTLSWTALLAAGRAIHAKTNFMTANGERLAGWTVFGGDVTAPAQAIAAEFDFDAEYVAAYMGGPAGKVLALPEPVDCDAEEWRGRMDACRAFVDRARAGNSPWTSASVAAACGIENYTYVETAPKNWARYRTDARQYAVSGVQFRGPQDWFAELYAAFHAGRLNESHPHRAEIERL